MNLFSRYFAPFVISTLALLVISSANAKQLAPVPLYGAYDMYLDRSQQTFNGHDCI